MRNTLEALTARSEVIRRVVVAVVPRGLAVRRREELVVVVLPVVQNRADVLLVAELDRLLEHAEQSCLGGVRVAGTEILLEGRLLALVAVALLLVDVVRQVLLERGDVLGIMELLR